MIKYYSEMKVPTTTGSRYSRIDQVKFADDSLYKI